MTDQRVAVPLIPLASAVYGVEARILKRRVILILDTGAQADLILHLPLARELDLRQLRTGSAAPVGEHAHDVSQFRLHRLYIGDVVRRNPVCIGIHLGAMKQQVSEDVDGMLGSLFLDRHNAVVDFRKRELTLSIDPKPLRHILQRIRE